MIKKIVAVIFLFSFGLQAQHTITGRLINPTKETWIILYKIEGAEQSFIANATVKDGRFSFKLKKDAKPGVYRLLYKIDRSDYLDFIYNNEDIDLAFNPKDPASTVVFNKSAENKIFENYARNIAIPQSKVDSLQLLYFQTTDKQKDVKIVKAYIAKINAVNNMQNKYENLSSKMLSYNFIRASKRYNAKLPFKNPEKYLIAIKKHFFDYIDFNNKILLKSTLIIDRINDFVFYVNVSQNPKTQNNLYKISIDDVFQKIDNKTLYKNMVYYFLKRFSNKDDKTITMFLLNNYFDKLPSSEQDLVYKKSILEQMKTVVNTKAPDITWQDFSGNHSLYQLKGAKYYLILFWSSTCSHCLRQVPLLYKYIKDKKDIKVVAVGLENGPNPWNAEMRKYPDFIQVFGKNHWQNKFAKAYNIHATPTYIMLDANKTIIAKPYSLDDLEKFINKLKM